MTEWVNDEFDDTDLKTLQDSKFEFGRSEAEQVSSRPHGLLHNIECLRVSGKETFYLTNKGICIHCYWQLTCVIVVQLAPDTIMGDILSDFRENSANTTRWTNDRLRLSQHSTRWATINSTLLQLASTLPQWFMADTPGWWGGGGGPHNLWVSAKSRSSLVSLEPRDDNIVRLLQN